MSGTWVLDSEGLSAYLRADKKMTARLGVAEEDDIRVAVSGVTIVEADHSAIHPARRDWVLSRLAVVPAGRDIGCAASDLLRKTGLHGHKYALDSIVVATALAASDRPVAILTSDPDDISILLDDRLDRKGLGRPAAPELVRVIPV